MARKKAPQDEEPTYSLSRGISAIVVFVLAVVTTLSFFRQAGPLGDTLDEQVISVAFGHIKYVFPIVLFVIATFLIKERTDDYRPTHGIGAVFFFLSLAGLFHLPFDTMIMWPMALAGKGGGTLGMVAYPLKIHLGMVASGVILVAILMIAVLFMFNTLIIKFFIHSNRLIRAIGSVGRLVLLFFVKNETLRNRLKYHNDEVEETAPYDEEVEDEEDYQEPDDEEDATVHRIGRFSRHREEDDEDQDNESSTQSATDGTEGPWSHKVIIKDLPPIDILTSKKTKPTSGDLEANAAIIHNTLAEFKIDVDMGETRVGPTVTQFTFKPPRGIRLSKITSLSNDLALALAAHPIRIEAPIPGKSLVGIEVPNQKTALVTCKELLESKDFRNRKHNMMIGLGKDVSGKIWFADLPRMPHLLVAGATGSGKTVCMNTIILSLLYQNTAETLRFIMIDPKRVELTLYNGIPHLLTPVITNTAQTVNALKWTIGEMERRFEALQSAGNRDITTYNQKHPHEKMPHIIFVIDELADLMASAANEVEAGIIRLAQMARAVGIHLVVATQRPSVDIITGLMKANIPGRVAFSVASSVDSRTIIDAPGAEKLLGRGDMLLSTAELTKPVRIQGAFVAEEELKAVIEYLKGDEEPMYDESIVAKQSGSTINMFGGADDDQDQLFDEAKREVIGASKASASFLQRKLKVGYARAARILDELEAAGIIGPANGAKPREILVTEAVIDDTMNTADMNVYDDHKEESGIYADDAEGDVEDDVDEHPEEEETFSRR